MIVRIVDSRGARPGGFTALTAAALDRLNAPGTVERALDWLNALADGGTGGR
ncbi:hypothetical protein [Streptomyces sp. NPDC085466]|uniref:hypothetical protein n=1 Tax=Streptomyces sp. NPDC085466 TaxID=3365725 RepID=UPI0037D776D4